MDLIQFIEQFGNKIVGGVATIVLGYFGYRVITYLEEAKSNTEELLKNHIKHIEDSTEKAVKQNKEMIEQNDNIHGTLEEILNETQDEK